MYIFFSQIYRWIAQTIYAKTSNLTFFHHQGLTLANTLFPDSVLGTKLPDFHLHLFYIKIFWTIARVSRNIIPLTYWNIKVCSYFEYFYRMLIFTRRLFKGQIKLYMHIARKPNKEIVYFPAVLLFYFLRTHFSHMGKCVYICQTFFGGFLSPSMQKKLTLFHPQDLTLVNTLFPDSVLGTKFPDFHLHLVFIKTSLRITIEWPEYYPVEILK